MLASGEVSVHVAMSTAYNLTPPSTVALGPPSRLCQVMIRDPELCLFVEIPEMTGWMVLVNT
jgi:hypothetical protein